MKTYDTFDQLNEAYAHATSDAERKELEQQNDRLAALCAESALARGDMNSYEWLIGKKHQARARGTRS